MKHARRFLLAAFALLMCIPASRAQSRDVATWTAHLSSEYAVNAGVPYLTANNVELKLDIYTPRGLTSPNATVIFYHGGGWTQGSREAAVLSLMPYLEMGFTVVNVSYRLAKVSPAPAAVEDCRCALLWVVRNAKQYNVDVNKIVLTGGSAGGHLALTSGMLPASAGLDRQCPSAFGPWPGPPVEEPKVAAIVNWFGITDVADLFAGPQAQGYAIAWMGSQLDRNEIAKRVSPLTYTRPGLPPVITIHGDADLLVPYAHAQRLHAELTRHGVINELVTVPGGGHGGFSREQNEKNFAAIRAFLTKLNLLKPRA